MITLNDTDTKPSDLIRNRHLEDFADFEKWYNSGDVYHGDSECLRNSRNWFQRVQEVHLGIRRYFNGVSLTGTVQMQSTTEKADKAKCQPLFEEIDALFPNLRSYYKIDEQWLWPVQSDGRRTGKTIRYMAECWNLSARKDKQTSDKLDSIIARLGQEWAKSRRSDDTYYYRLDTSAIGFAMLGHYGPDGGSCFEAEGAHEDHKFKLGSRVGNSFVLVVKRESFDKDGIPKMKGNIMRCWGFMQPDAVVYTNFYTQKISPGDTSELTKRISSSLLKSQSLHLKEGKSVLLNATDLYLNKDAIVYSTNPDIEVRLTYA